MVRTTEDEAGRNRTSCQPTFSVIIPSFDRPDLVLRAAASVLRQTWSEFELIIVNDGSSQDYGSVLMKLDDPRVRLLENPTNRGAAAARNRGIEEAGGHYVALLDDDDEYYEDFLASTHKTLAGTPEEVGVSWCGVDWREDVGGGRSLSGAVQEFATSYSSERELFEAFLAIGTGYGVCVKASCLAVVGGFDDSLMTTEDTDWFLRILVAGYRPVVTEGVHIAVHNHSGQRLTGSDMFGRNIDECATLLQRYEGYFRQHDTLRRQLSAHMQHLEQELTRLSVPLTAAPAKDGNVEARG